MKFWIVFFLFFLLLLSAEESSEKLFLLEDNTFHETELSENLNNLAKNPIYFPKAKFSDFKQLPWLSDSEILLMIKNQPLIKSLRDLKKIGINKVTISEIKPFIIFEREQIFSFNFRSRLSFKSIFESKKYPLKTYTRIKGNYKNLSAGFLIQKDPEENRFDDFFSSYLLYNHSSNGKYLLGSFRLACGQGLLFSPQLGASKTSATTTVPLKKYKLFKPYTSSFEMWDLFGSALTINFSDFGFTPFYSKNYYDASLDENQITSFNLTGNHGNNKNKNNVENEIFGSILHYQKSSSQLGFIFYEEEFSHYFQNNFKKKNRAFSIYFSQEYQKIIFAGEMAKINKKIAHLYILKWDSGNLSNLLLFRKYDEKIGNWHAKPFSATSLSDNEIGLYFGSTIKPNRQLKITSYFDIWKHPQKRHFEKMITYGNEQFFQMEYKIGKERIRLTLKRKSKDKFISEKGEMIRNFERDLVRLDYFQRQGKLLNKMRIEYSCEKVGELNKFQKGILTAHSLIWDYSKFQLDLTTAIFKSSILLYLYERSVSGIMQNSILKGDDLYSYFLLKYKVSQNLSLQTKVSRKWADSQTLTLYFQIVGDGI